MFNTNELRRITTIAFVLVVMLSGRGASAQISNNWSFSLLPTGGTISGAPGSTIGWGYNISNLSSSEWLFVTDIAASGPFLDCSVNSAPFDYPILAPLTSVSEVYNGSSGLAQLTWDNNAPVGVSNSGTFAMDADFYDGDPFNGGNYIGDAGIQTAAYQASVTPAAVPEASTALSLSLGLLPLGLFAVRRRLKRKTASS